MLFVAAPEYDEIYVSLNRRSQPYNRLVSGVYVPAHDCTIGLLPSCRGLMAELLGRGKSAMMVAVLGFPSHPSLAQQPRRNPRLTATIASNAQVALPLSLTQLGDRLRSGYYRQPAALACDIATIASNASTFNGADSELADDAAALAAYLTLSLQGQVGGMQRLGSAAPS